MLSEANSNNNNNNKNLSSQMLLEIINKCQISIKTTEWEALEIVTQWLGSSRHRSHLSHHNRNLKPSSKIHLVVDLVANSSRILHHQTPLEISNQQVKTNRIMFSLTVSLTCRTFKATTRITLIQLDLSLDNHQASTKVKVSEVVV